jgi:hypothetical protein
MLFPLGPPQWRKTSEQCPLRHLPVIATLLK